MRRRFIILLILICGQLLSVVALFFFIPHLSQIWYNHGLGWMEAIKAEYNQGGVMMIVEFVVIVLVLIGTVVFEIRLLISASKAEKNLADGLKELQEHMDSGFNKLSNQISKRENDKTAKNE